MLGIFMFVIPSLKTKTHGNSTWFFPDCPWKLNFFKNWPLAWGISTCYFFIPGNFMPLLLPSCIFFFWNSPNPFSRNLIDTDGFQNCSKWITKTAKHFKWNTISDNIHDSETISSNFDEEIPLIKEKFMKTDYSLCFINTVVNEFQKS